MPRATARDPIYRRRHFAAETIELCVRWCITYRLSYGDLVAMMADRGINVAHTTMLRWVQRYVPEYERRWSRFTRPVNSSWRLDETAVPVRRGRDYLHRAVDRHRNSVGSRLCDNRDIPAAQAFFREAVDSPWRTGWPRKVNLDGNTATHRALRLPGDEDPRRKSVVVRGRRYLNNIVAQDHRAIKRRCASMLGLKSFRTAAITLAGVELAHRIHKRQFAVGRWRRGRPAFLQELWERALA
jgi:transposase-like protein